MHLFSALLVIIWVILIALYALINGLAASRSSGPAPQTRWWAVVLLSGFLATFTALAISGIVSLF